MLWWEGVPALEWRRVRWGVSGWPRTRPSSGWVRWRPSPKATSREGASAERWWGGRPKKFKLCNWVHAANPFFATFWERKHQINPWVWCSVSQRVPLGYDSGTHHSRNEIIITSLNPQDSCGISALFLEQFCHSKKTSRFMSSSNLCLTPTGWLWLTMTSQDREIVKITNELDCNMVHRWF